MKSTVRWFVTVEIWFIRKCGSGTSIVAGSLWLGHSQEPGARRRPPPPRRTSGSRRLPLRLTSGRLGRSFPASHGLVRDHGCWHATDPRGHVVPALEIPPNGAYGYGNAVFLLD